MADTFKILCETSFHRIFQPYLRAISSSVYRIQSRNRRANSTDSGVATLLVVEDDHETRVSLRTALESEGYRVLSAGNGNQALELLRANELPSLIVMDLIMPGMDGNELTQHLMSHPSWRLIPVVVLSAYLERAIRGHAKAMLAKPVDLRNLLFTVNAHLPGRLRKP